MGDGNLHRHSNLPTLMAGKLGGQFETGRHIAYKLDTPMSNLLVSDPDEGRRELRSDRGQHGPAGSVKVVRRVRL